MCIHHIAPVNTTFDTPTLVGYDSTLDNCDYVDVDQRIAISDNDIGLLHLNIRGLTGKSEQFKKMHNENFGEHSPDILFLCETWMSKNSPTLRFPGYNMFETRRTHKKGGGTCVLVKDTIQSKRCILEDELFNCIEYTLVECKINSKSYIAGSLYRAPNTNQREFLSEYDKLLNLITIEKPYGILLGMDHNLDLLKSCTHNLTQEFIECNVKFGLTPSITKPTRITKNSATLIDNIFISENFLGKHFSRIIIDDISDHLPCVTVLENVIKSKKSRKQVISRDLRPKNIEKLKAEILQLNNRQYNYTNVNLNFEKYHADLCNAIETHCPIRTRMIPSHKFRNLPWITSGLFKSMGQSKRLYQRFISDQTNCLLEDKYKTYRNILNNVKRSCKIKYYQEKCEEFKKNTRKLWQLINDVIHRSNDKSSIIDCIKVDNIEIHDKKIISNKFGEYFSQLGSKFANKIRKPKYGIDTYLKVISRNCNSIFVAPTSVCEIVKLISALPNKKSSGYDNIDNILLKKIESEISPMLVKIFNQSLSNGVFPESMKLAEVVPLFKSNDKTLTENYRPISLLITLSKILEKIVYKRTYSFLQEQGLLYNSQYGFRSSHSCENAITELIGCIIKAQELGKYTAALFLDLSKAFDTLEHTVLLKKLEIYGIRGPLLDWYGSYLNQRQLMAKCNNTLSDKYVINYGTPQGSCLGPLLFIIFCNDLHLHLTFLSCIQFADDTTLYCSEKSSRLIESNFSHDLVNIYDWFCANKLTLNAKKSICMVFAPNKKKITDFSLKIGDTVIEPVTETKFLGLWLDHKLTWKKHYTELINKLNHGLNLLRKAKKLLNSTSLISLYYAHFHSHLTYAMIVWSGMYGRGMLNRLQKKQNQCIKIVNSKKIKSIIKVDDLIKIELCKLGFKIIHCLLPKNLNDCLNTNASGHSLTRKHRYSTRNKSDLRIPMYKRDSFLNKCTKEFIKLKTEIKLSKSIPELVRQLKLLARQNSE